MIKVTNIETHKEKRKLRRVISDLEEAEKLLTLITKGLAGYKKYTPIRDIITNILENKALVKIYLKKYQEILKEKQNDTQKLQD